MRTNIVLYSIVFVGLSLLVSCQKEDSPSNTHAGTTMLRLFVQPEGIVPTDMTRALTDADENIVKEIDVLMFDSYSDSYLASYAANLTQSGAIYTASAKIQLRPQPVDFIVIANARNEVQAATANFVGNTTTRAAALAALNYQLMNTSTLEYNWGTGTSFRGVPMSALLDNISINSSNTNQDLNSNSSPIQLIRHIAKISVVNNATSSFTLQNIWLYQAQMVTGLGSTTPQAGSAQFANGALLGTSFYMVPHDNTTAGATPVDPNAPFLVFEGRYDNKTVYYRIDFYTNQAIDIKANHQYTFTIKEIARAGYATQAEAASKPVGDNVRSNIGQAPPSITVGIDHPSLAYIHEEYLYMSTSNVVEGSGTFTETIQVKTSNMDAMGNPDWSAESSAAWLTVTPNPSNHTLTLSAGPTTADRKAEVTIRSNRLRQTINVDQLVNGFAIVDSVGKPLVMVNDTLFLRQGASSGLYQIKSAYDWGIEYIIIDDNPTPLLTGFTQTGLKGLTYWKYQIRALTSAENQAGFKRSEIADVSFINIDNGQKLFKVIFKYKD